MNHNRCVNIAYVRYVDMDTLRYWLEKSAETASVGINISSRPGDGYFSDCLLVTVHAWSGNEGSVDDFHRSLLVPLSRGANSNTIISTSLYYIDRVERWCQGVITRAATFFVFEFYTKCISRQSENFLSLKLDSVVQPIDVM